MEAQDMRDKHQVIDHQVLRGMIIIMNIIIIDNHHYHHHYH